MFTGLVEDTLTVKSLDESQDKMVQLSVEAPQKIEVQTGDSIAINGCCLTITDASDSNTWCFDVSRETLDKTNLGELKSGDAVNFERPMLMTTRLDGHIVSGHVDEVVAVTRFESDPQGTLVEVSIPEASKSLVIDKGSICLNGVSLTINEVRDQAGHTLVSLMLIPTTLEKTTFKCAAVGSRINVEYDIVGKYILRQRN